MIIFFQFLNAKLKALEKSYEVTNLIDLLLNFLIIYFPVFTNVWKTCFIVCQIWFNNKTVKHYKYDICFIALIYKQLNCFMYKLTVQK